ncbi:GNAT family N-acetyltransferase [Martelella alba]|nr:GNAT family N-acetyltransferase [Martelella alba]
MNTDLPLVRRLEAMGLRAWPAKTVVYDGAWQYRLTAGHPSKRLNSITVLDQSDIADIEIRLEKARRHYASFGRQMLLRETPLTPSMLIEYLSDEGAVAFDETIVMTRDLTRFSSEETLDLLPSQDIGRFADAVLAVKPEDGLTKPGLAEVVTGIRPAHGFFIREESDRTPLAVGLCVQDFEMAGIELLAVSEDHRRQGLGRSITTAMLHWAKARAARLAWLQVTGTNTPAITLYRNMGFTEAYRYRYWRETEI